MWCWTKVLTKLGCVELFCGVVDPSGCGVERVNGGVASCSGLEAGVSAEMSAKGGVLVAGCEVEQGVPSAGSGSEARVVSSQVLAVGDSSSGGSHGSCLLQQLALCKDDLGQDEVEQPEAEDVFTLDDSELGCTSLVRHMVDIRDHPPIKQLPRRMPFSQKGKVAELVDDMLEKGVIQPSASAWASPIVLVPKRDGSLRFCVDYRKVNAVMKKNVYPLPRIDDILDTLSEARYFSRLDLASGFWQIEMDPATREKSAFVTYHGLHEFVRMPFGLCNTPATFQWLMQVVLAGQEWKYCFVYLDNILVCSKTFG